ncbi:MAG: DNA polymerase [bacterium]|nr:DNA polymerase [bacterium]
MRKLSKTPRIIQLLKDNKEEAEFSKMLATIRRDAPVTFVFPEKTFKENLDIKKVTALWTKLELRTLIQRLQKAVSDVPRTKPAPRAEQEFSEPDMEGSRPRVEKSDNPNATLDFKPAIIVDSEELEKTLLALWLVNSNLTNPNLDDVLNFGNTDSFTEAQRIVYTELDKRGLRRVYENIELPLIPIVKKMETHGIKVDKEFLAGLSKTYHKELDRLDKEITKHAGMEFNINSPKQLGEVLFDKMGLTAKNLKKTAGGARSTRESELEKMRDLHPIVPMIFEHRELSKLLSTYIDAIPPQLDAQNHLHSHLVSAGSTTGRMASLNPNLQNIPVKTELGKAIRNAFISEKGFKLCAFDYSQMELRIAAFMSNDEKLIDIFTKGEDVHTSVAAFVFKVPQDQVTSDMRRKAKVINFGIIYGMGVSALKQNLGTSRDEAQNFLNDYFATFSGLAQYLNNVKSETALRGYTETFYGRRRYFEGIKSKLPFIRAAAERMAINAPIQGTEADVIKLAMQKIDEYIQKEKLENDVHALLQVHDELVYEIREDKVKKVAADIEKIMETVMDPKDTKGVILKATAHIGNNWGELK